MSLEGSSAGLGRGQHTIETVGPTKLLYEAAPIDVALGAAHDRRCHVGSGTRARSREVTPAPKGRDDCLQVRLTRPGRCSVARFPQSSGRANDAVGWGRRPVLTIGEEDQGCHLKTSHLAGFQVACRRVMA